MLEPEVLVEALGVLVLSALAVMVGLALLVLLGKVDNPEWLEREDPQGRKDRQALKDRQDRLVQLEAEEQAQWGTPTKDTATTPESTTPTTPVKGKEE